MKFIFNSYPAHLWLAEWTFEPINCSASFRRDGSERFFQTQETVGCIVPNVKLPAWSCQISMPKNSRIVLLFNGFCAYLEKRGRQYAAEVICPEPGVLWGRVANIPPPDLFTQLPLEAGTDAQWLEQGRGSVLLAIRSGIFCLVSKSPTRAEAERVAESYFSKDLEAALSEELDRRDDIHDLYTKILHKDSLIAISAELVMKARRPAEGAIPLTWCQASYSEAPMLDVNELYLLTSAWQIMDIDAAEELLLCALKIQTQAGVIPARYTPHAAHSVLEAPKPLLAKNVETVWEVRKSPLFLDKALPLLRRYLQWLLRHFDPKRSGLHRWQNRGEALVTDLFTDNMATVDLAVLLITEINAFDRLCERSICADYNSGNFESERSVLEHNILHQFWNEKESLFSTAILRDKKVSLPEIPQFISLLWKDIPYKQKRAILERMGEENSLPGSLNALNGSNPIMENQSFPLFCRLLALQALQISDPQGQLINNFTRGILQGFAEWYAYEAQEKKRLPINTVTAAYILSIQAVRHDCSTRQKGYFFRLVNKIKVDRFDIAIFAVTVFAIIGVRTIYSVINAPPAFILLEDRMNTAYDNGNMDEVLIHCMDINEHYPEKADEALYLSANISMIRQQYEEAGRLYEQIRRKHPDSPGPMVSLGVSYQLQGRFQEAETNYYEFCYLFENIFPELVEEIERFRTLVREELRIPPKWRKIYRYPLMRRL